MKILPAIDIRGGKCVRLFQGNYKQETIYGEDPIVVAKQWKSQGALSLHVVDLDGAKGGQMKNYKIIKNIVKAVSVPIQVGGGIRDIETIDKLFACGVEKVVLGTIALNDIDYLKKMLKKYPNRIVVSLDSKNGLLAIDGWLKKTEKQTNAFAKNLEKLGVRKIIFTDIAKDGALNSPNFREVASLLKNISIPLTVAGGISSIEDLKKLKEMNVDSVIIGKALYENKFSLQEALYVS